MTLAPESIPSPSSAAAEEGSYLRLAVAVVALLAAIALLFGSGE